MWSLATETDSGKSTGLSTRTSPWTFGPLLGAGWLRKRGSVLKEGRSHTYFVLSLCAVMLIRVVHKGICSSVSFHDSLKAEITQTSSNSKMDKQNEVFSCRRIFKPCRRTNRSYITISNLNVEKKSLVYKPAESGRFHLDKAQKQTKLKWTEVYVC